MSFWLNKSEFITMVRSLPLTIFLSLLNLLAWAQTPQVSFSLQTNACISENIKPVNQSINITDSEWDFCERDLLSTPQFMDDGVISPAAALVDLRIKYNNGRWYGFVCDGDANKLTQLNFGTSLSNIPTQNQIADFSSPSGVELVQLNGVWYGLVGTFSQPSQLYLLNFGASLDNLPQISKVILPADAIVSSRSIRLVQEGTDIIAFIANSAQQKITRVNFGSSLSQNVVAVDLIDIGEGPLLGMDIMEDGGNKYLFVNSYGTNTMLKLSFGNSWKSPTPVIQAVLLGTSYISPAMIDIEFEGGNYIIITTLTSGQIYRLNFGPNLSGLNPIIDDLGTYGDMTNVRGMDVVRDNGSYSAFFSSFSTNKLYRLLFKDLSCPASVSLSTDDNPPLISYSSSGVFPITLRVKGSGLLSEKKTSSLTVMSSVAPTIGIAVINKQCLSAPNEFSVNSSDALTDYSWDFGDSQLSNISNPVHNYSTNGSFPISLEVTGANGCKNRAQSQIVVSSAPDFLLPDASPVCTSVPYSFGNLTSFDANYEPTWTWSLNGLAVTNQKTFTTSFNSTGLQEIKLSSSNGGCTNQIIKTFNITATGSLTDFSAPIICEQTQAQFENHSANDIVSMSWDFGDGFTSDDVNPQHTYASENTYTVKLKTISSNGCINQKSKQIQAFSKPQPDFSLDLPPFSCSGTPSQFNDLTPSPTDSNLSSWAWSFGDAASGTSTDKNPLYTFAAAGDYSVSLTAITNFGCSASVQKTVTIAASPPISFTSTPACINQGTRFTDASGPGIKSWLWTMGNSTYSFSNPTHVFSNAGNYNVQLTVTGANDCVATLIKAVHVPLAPSLNFAADNACEAQLTNFKDTTPASMDPAASWSWDFAGQETKTGATPQHAFAKTGTYSVRMTTTQQSGCVYSLSKNITINPTPLAAFTSSPESGTPPLTVQFNNTSTGASTYLWHFNDQKNTTSTLASPEFQFIALGDYVVDLLATSALGCSSSVSGKISVVIPSLDVELKELKLVKDPASGAYRMLVTVKNKSNFLLTSIDVVIDISGNALIKETINTRLAPEDELEQLLNNQILPGSNALAYLCASLEADNDKDPLNNSKCEPLEEETIVFDPYPNPSAGAFKLEWISPTNAQAHFEIFNSIGQVVFEQYAENVQVGLNLAQINLEPLTTGAYYLRFSANSTVKTVPIQIVR